jgi:hypothetical protein
MFKKLYFQLFFSRWKAERSGPEPSKLSMMVYNADRSISGYISPSEDVYNDLFKAGTDSIKFTNS